MKTLKTLLLPNINIYIYNFMFGSGDNETMENVVVAAATLMIKSCHLFFIKTLNFVL